MFVAGFSSVCARPEQPPCLQPRTMRKHQKSLSPQISWDRTASRIGLNRLYGQ